MVLVIFYKIHIERKRTKCVQLNMMSIDIEKDSIFVSPRVSDNLDEEIKNRNRFYFTHLSSYCILSFWREKACGKNIQSQATVFWRNWQETAETWCRAVSVDIKILKILWESTYSRSITNLYKRKTSFVLNCVFQIFFPFDLQLIQLIYFWV